MLSRAVSNGVVGRLLQQALIKGPLSQHFAMASTLENRRPFRQKDSRRHQLIQERMLPAVPKSSSPFVQAWLSSWETPRAGIVQLRADVWSLPERPDVVHNIIAWQRSCMRQGTSQTKSRHEVRGGGKKPRPQKGTGRSRQGSIRVSHWKGGGHAHPKRPRDFSYKMNLKVHCDGCVRTCIANSALIFAGVTCIELHRDSA